MPLETGSICNYAQCILIEMRNSGYNLKNHHPAARFGNPPMYCTDLMVMGDQIDLCKGSLYLIYCREL